MPSAYDINEIWAEYEAESSECVSFPLAASRAQDSLLTDEIDLTDAGLGIRHLEAPPQEAAEIFRSIREEIRRVLDDELSVGRRKIEFIDDEIEVPIIPRHLQRAFGELGRARAMVSLAEDSQNGRCPDLFDLDVENEVNASWSFIIEHFEENFAHLARLRWPVPPMTLARWSEDYIWSARRLAKHAREQTDKRREGRATQAARQKNKVRDDFVAYYTHRIFVGDPPHLASSRTRRAFGSVARKTADRWIKIARAN